jgi:hypothetical protein
MQKDHVKGPEEKATKKSPRKKGQTTKKQLVGVD